LIASSGSTSLARRLAGVSSLGVSSSIGSRANRRSLTIRRNAAAADVFVPIHAAPARLLRIVHVKGLQA